jgi:hypothetical protein
MTEAQTVEESVAGLAGIVINPGDTVFTFTGSYGVQCTKGVFRGVRTTVTRGQVTKRYVVERTDRHGKVKNSYLNFANHMIHESASVRDLEGLHIG